MAETISKQQNRDKNSSSSVFRVVSFQIPLVYGVYGGRGLPLKILQFFKDLIKDKRKKIKTESKMERDCKTNEKQRLKVK